MKNTLTPTTEAHLQASCVIWFKNTYRPLRQLLYMVHNDGNKNPIQASQDIARGLTKGWPDLNLDIPAGGYHGLRIEMKKPGEKPEPHQIEIHELLRSKGYQVIVIDNLEDFKSAITNYLSS
jgi:hypothetical protein